jgi:hypothetical protein
MANQKPLIVVNGTNQQLPNADTLVVGTGIDAAAAGTLTIGGTTATSITLGSATIPVSIPGDVTTVGGTTFTTDATFEGDVTFGNAATDTVTFTAEVDSDIAFKAPGYKITNLANGTNPGDAVNFSQLSAIVSGVSAVTASSPLSSSGGATPDISFPSWPPDASGALTNDGAGNLSWAAAPATSLTVGTTAIASGAANRVLFEGAGNVLQESANLLWDGSAFTVNGVVSVGEGSAPSATAAFGKLWANSAADARPYWLDDTGQSFNLTLDRFNTLTPAASVAIDTSPALPVFNSIALNQNTTFTTSNLGNGRSASVRVVCDASTRTLSFPGTWTWLGSGPPSSLAANDVGYLSITAYGATDADVVAAWSYENQPAAVTGSGVDNQIAVWSGTNTQDGSSALTFNGTTLGLTGGITQSGGAVSLTANAASSFTTSAGALTLASAAAVNLTSAANFQISANGNATTWPTAAGAANSVLTNNGSGTLSWAAAPAASLTVGTTAIASGTVGRVLFQGTGNVLQQSGNLFWDNSSTRLGVGTSAPTYAFEVASPANDGANVMVFSATAADRPLMTLTRGRGSISAPTALQSGDLIGEFGWAGSTAVGTLAGASKIRSTATEVWNFGSLGSDIRFLTVPNGTPTPTERMIISQSGAVGIGTSTPAYRLDVAANTAGGVAQFSNANASGYAAADFTIAGTQRFSIGYCGAAQGLLQNNAYFYSQNSDLMIMVQDTAATSLRPSVTFKSAETAFNDNSQNIDFRVESDGNANMLLVDASQDSVSIGTTGNTHTFNIGSGSSSNFAVASGGRIHTYDGSAPTDGQVLIGDTALGNFAKATLTAGSGISITNGAGSITIAATGGGGGSLNPVRSADLGPSGLNTRVFGTTYQNTTGVAIWVQVPATMASGGGAMLGFVDANATLVNTSSPTVEVFARSNNSLYAETAAFYVPAGSYYKVAASPGTVIRLWFEYQLLGSGNTPITTISTTTTLDATYYTVLCSATLTVNLPAAASSSGQVYNIKNIGSGTTITIDPNASETIDGATTYTLTTQYESVSIQCDGSNWFIL